MKKQIKKTSAPAKKTAPKAVGVIASIVEAISGAKGASAEEILAVLTKKFPDRKPEGMLNTIRIQANKNAKSKEKIDGRGLVYFGKAR
jgi:hypothetical protein